MYNVLLAIVLLLNACTGRKTPIADVVAETDSIGYELLKGGVQVTVSMDTIGFADEVLVKSLAGWMAELMEIQLPATYTSDFRQLPQLLVEAKFPELKEETSAGPEDCYPSTTYTADFKVVLSNDTLVSYQGQIYWYVSSTAHPGGKLAGITFRKSDGHSIGDSLLLNTDTPAFRQLLRQGLISYLKQELEVDTESDMNSFLNPDIGMDSLPMPRQSPYLTQEGIALAYEEYEIIAHVTPLIVIPYADARPYLTSAGWTKELK